MARAVGIRRQRTLPGTTYFVTRRTTRRHFVLTPDEGGVVERTALYLQDHAGRRILTWNEVTAEVAEALF